MKIKSNSTKYDSKRLKQIFSECYNIVKKKEGKLWRWKGLNVEPNYSMGLKEDENEEREGTFNLGLSYKF